MPRHSVVQRALSAPAITGKIRALRLKARILSAVSHISRSAESILRGALPASIGVSPRSRGVDASPRMLCNLAFGPSLRP